MTDDVLDVEQSIDAEAVVLDAPGAEADRLAAGTDTGLGAEDVTDTVASRRDGRPILRWRPSTHSNPRRAHRWHCACAGSAGDEEDEDDEETAFWREQRSFCRRQRSQADRRWLGCGAVGGASSSSTIMAGWLAGWLAAIIE